MKIARIGTLGAGLAILGLLVLARLGQEPPRLEIEAADDSSRSADSQVPAAGGVSAPARADGQSRSGSSAAGAPREPVADEAIQGQQPARAGSPVPGPSAAPDSTGASDQRMQAVREQLAELVESEDEDPDWSPEMESRIYSELSLLAGLTASLIDVDCRTLHCIVEITLAPASRASPSVLTTDVDGRRVFVAAAALDLETVALLFLGGPGELPAFVAYLRRGEDSTTQSTPVAIPSS